MDKFLEELSFPKWKRALAARAGQQYVLQLKGGSANGSLDDATIQIVTSDIRGKSSLELPLSGRGVVAHDGDNGAEVERSARPLDDRTVEITESYRGESRPYSVCKRTLTVSAIATTAPCPPLHPPRHPRAAVPSSTAPLAPHLLLSPRPSQEDGRMLLEVRKRAPNGRMASMRAIASRIADKAAHNFI